MTRPAVHALAPAAGVGGQQLPEDAAAGLQHSGPDHGLGRLQAVAVAAQRPCGLGRQPAYLRGLLPRAGLEEPFSPSGAEGASVPAAGRASQILSLTPLAHCATVPR